MGGLPTREVTSGPIAIPHLVHGRKVGTTSGFYLLRQVIQVRYEGWFEAGVAFSLGRDYPVLAADVDTTSPDDDADKRIQGALPSDWNRRVVTEGARGIVVEGNLALARLTDRARRAGTRRRRPLRRLRLRRRCDGDGARRAALTLAACLA